MEWISVNDRLPEKVGFYLVNVGHEVAAKHRGTVEIGECYKSVDTSCLTVINKFHDYVTHWQELPEPPKQ